jgi:hypothetical protein
MKYLILFLLSLPAYAAEIDSVRVGINTMLVTGTGLDKVAKAQLGKKPVAVMPVTNTQAVIYCRNLTKGACANERWVPGTYTLKLYRKGKSLPYLKYPVTITGQETVDRPVPPEVISPTPVG